MKFSTLYEQYLGAYRVTSGVATRNADFYMNEPIEKIIPWARGVITKDGDLYTGQAPPNTLSHRRTPSLAVVHSDILAFISKRTGHLYQYNDFENVLNVQRSGDGILFYLGESYNFYGTSMPEMEKSTKVKAMVDKFHKKNPDKKLKLQQIAEHTF